MKYCPEGIFFFLYIYTHLKLDFGAIKTLRVCTMFAVASGSVAATLAEQQEVVSLEL